MNNNQKGFIIMAVILLSTIILYFTKFGGEHFIFITDFLAVLYSFVAIITGLYAIKVYSLKSLHGKTLFLMILGVTSWFVADLIWLIFSQSAMYYCEFFRFLGYVPFAIAFFRVLPISDPEFRKKGMKSIYFFIFFLILAIAYLNIIPVVFGGTSLLENVLNNGYIVTDFVLLFGILLLLRTSLIFRKGALSSGWLIVALALLSTFIFDIYFAFNYSTYFFGSPIEIFWLLTYVLLAYGFFYQYQAIKDLLPDEKSKKAVKDRKFIVISIAILTLLLSLFLLLYFVVIPFFQVEQSYKFSIEYRNDVNVVFTKEVLDTLNNRYSINSGEYLFCLIGNKTNKEFIVYDLVTPELFLQNENFVISHEDPACQIENSLGSIHSHIVENCRPSYDDIFSFGEMKNPEPVINAIQCDTDKFYIMLMPEKHEALDFRSLKWKIRD